MGILALGAVLVAGGCGPSKGDGSPSTTQNGDTSSSKPSLAADAPSDYDPCNDIPQSVLDSEQLRSKEKEDSNAAGGIKWRGCAWIQTDGYSPSIRTTNLTVDMVRDKKFQGALEFTINGRRAISTRQNTDHPEAVCTVNVEMKAGSLEVFLSNPPSRKKTGALDTCQLARTLTEKVVPTMPASV
ncbi:DUF3558 domain-containing protein [Nocardia brasiliensis]|uniref:DUF3558 domain-containing protein n=1 Tax=Nocardia brasiliensis TaxID=37326 RepID=UPI001EEC61F0|nr:DUF3558 domain-containing protein [Nocardia brasiliensis]